MLAVDPQDRITAAEAVHHPFFEGSPTDVKLKFQSQKKKDPHSKLWQTQNFVLQNPPKLDLNEDHVEDENIIIKVPISNKARLQHHAHHKNLTLGPTPIPKKDGFKKSTTIEFNISSPDSQSPDAQSPGMIISFGHHPVNNLREKHSLFEKYQQNNGIQELEEDK